MKKGRPLPLFLLTLIFIFATAGISRADFQGTVGTRFTVTGSAFGDKKPKVYIEYVKKSGAVKKIKAKVETWSDTSITCLWKKPVSPGTYHVWVQPDIRGAVPSVVDTFSIMNPAIDTITLDNPANTKKITLTGWYFTNKKPKVYLKDLVSLRKKRCRVVSSSMDSATGASSLKFIVPKWGSDNYAIVLQTRVGETSFTLSSVSGTITDSSTGDGLSGVLLSLVGAASNSVITGNDGTYSLTNIQNGSYTMTPFKSGYTFTPQNITIIVNNTNITGQDFVGTPEGSPSEQLTLNINPSVLPTGIVNSLYRQDITIAASGGNPPYTYSCSVAGGSGISASITPSSDISFCNFCPVCTIEGTPADSGQYTVTVQVTDASQSVAAANASLNAEHVFSPDWHPKPSGTTSDLTAVSYGNGVFVAAGDGGTVLVSTDGAIWTGVDSGTTSDLTAVSYGNGIFVAAGNDPTTLSNSILTSSDGMNWTQRNTGLPPASATYFFSLSRVAYGDGIYIATGMINSFPFGPYDNFALTSPDGITWTKADLGTDNEIGGIAYGSGIFVAVGCSVLTSPDGAIWTQTNQEITYDTCSLKTVVSGNGIFAAAGYGGIILTSPDGSVWSRHNSGTLSSLYGIAYGNNTFVAVGSDGTILQPDPVE